MYFDLASCMEFEFLQGQTTIIIYYNNDTISKHTLIGVIGAIVIPIYKLIFILLQVPRFKGFVLRPQVKVGLYNNNELHVLRKMTAGVLANQNCTSQEHPCSTSACCTCQQPSCCQDGQVRKQLLLVPPKHPCVERPMFVVHTQVMQSYAI